MSELNDVSIFDCDNHLYETRDSLTKFLPKRHKGLVQYVDVAGRTKIAVKGKISDYIPNPTFDVVARPGAQEDYFRHGNPEGKSYRDIYGEPMRAIPAFREPEARIQAMDELGIDRTMMYPTLASLIEERLRDDPEATHIVIHALNEWIYETWRFNYENRIFTTPVITLAVLDKAIEELEWVLERGAPAVLIRPAPPPSYRGGARSFALPEFDPFWQKIVENDVAVMMHGSDSGYSRYYGDWVGSTEFLPFQPQAFQRLWSFRPAADAVGSWVCHGALSRFPQLKVVVVELGSSWVEPLLKELSYLYKKMPQEFAEHPVDIIRRNVYLCPFWEENLADMAQLLGEDHVLFGSDWPHPEGLAQPATYLNELSHLPEATVRKFMGGNLARLINIPAIE